MSAARATDARPSILVVTMGTDYVAPARLPYELARAGFAVSLLAPHDSLATQTSYVERISHFPDRVTFHEWVHALAGTVRAVHPDLLLPGDDVALRSMLHLVLEPPEGLRDRIRADLEALIVASIGDPAQCLRSMDKSRMLDAAAEAGVRVAEGGVAGSEGEAVTIAERIGYPVVVRPAFGTAGAGIGRCSDRNALLRHLRTAPRTDGWDPDRASRRLVVQRWIDGEVVTRASLAWHGLEVAGFTRGRLETHPAPFGPASVVEFAGLPAVAAATRRLFATLGVHGYAGTQFMLEPGSAEPYLIEINRRMLPATHAGRLVGIDLAEALASAMRGAPWTGPTDLAPGPGRRLALFPQEWHRDPASPWLTGIPVDAPWHDPRLFAAMLHRALDAAQDNDDDADGPARTSAA